MCGSYSKKKILPTTSHSLLSQHFHGFLRSYTNILTSSSHLIAGKTFLSNRLLFMLLIICSPNLRDQKLRSWANAVFQNRGVCGQAFPSLPSPSPSFFFFALVPTFSTNSRGNACYAGYFIPLPLPRPFFFFCSRPNFLDELARKRLLRRLAVSLKSFLPKLQKNK